MNITKVILLGLLASAFSACSTFSEERSAHQNVERITVDSQTPSETQDKTNSAQAQAQTQVAPNIVDSQSAALSSALGPPAAQAPVAAVLKPSSVESVNVGGQMGLSVNLPYQQVWTQTKTALPQAGYPVMEQDAASGTYYILDKVSTGGVIKRDTPIYQLHLKKTQDNKTVITINNAQNQAASTQVAERVLNTLKNKFPS